MCTIRKQYLFTTITNEINTQHRVKHVTRNYYDESGSVSWFSSVHRLPLLNRISGTGFFTGRVSKHWTRHKALTPTSVLASSRLHPDSPTEGRCSTCAGFPTSVALYVRCSNRSVCKYPTLMSNAFPGGRISTGVGVAEPPVVNTSQFAKISAAVKSCTFRVVVALLPATEASH